MAKNITSHRRLHEIAFCELLDLWSCSMDTLCKAKDAVLQFKFIPDTVMFRVTTQSTLLSGG